MLLPETYVCSGAQSTWDPPPFSMPGVKERSQQQMKHSSLEDELVDTFQKQGKQTSLKGKGHSMGEATGGVRAPERLGDPEGRSHSHSPVVVSLPSIYERGN